MADPGQSGWAEVPGRLVRSALGRKSFIGELYDARHEKFCTESLFLSTFPDISIQQTPLSGWEVDVSYRDKISDRFDLLGIKPEYQLSILLDHLQLEGHTRFLKKENGTLSGNISITIPTVKEELMIKFQTLKPHINKYQLDNETFTHVVAGINWGGRCVFSLEFNVSEFSSAAEAEISLKENLQKLASALKQGTQETSYDDLELDKIKIKSLQVFSDVVLTQKTLNNGIEVMGFKEEFPDVIQTLNNGRGRPMTYVLVPISFFKTYLDCKNNVPLVLKPIEEILIMQLVRYFEKLNILKQSVDELEKDFGNYKKYLPDSCYQRIASAKQQIQTKEANLKLDLANDITNFKIGNITKRDFIDKLDGHMTNTLNLAKMGEFVAEYDSLKVRTKFIDECASANIFYLTKDENLDFLKNKETTNDFYVMFISGQIFNNNANLGERTLNFFKSQAQNPKPDARFIVVDYDINPDIPRKVEEVKILHSRRGQIISHDYLRDYESENMMNFAKLIVSTSIVYTKDKPIKRVTLELPCPGYTQGTCPKVSLVWNCSVCKNILEYDFDNNFYCACGKAAAKSYQFKCCNPQHGEEYLSMKTHLIKKELGKLKPLKEMNILILGQSGVGKSTWINSIVNYLSYESLEDAEKNGVICVIPAQFSCSYVTDEGCENQIVQVGDVDQNEFMSVGKSATQGPKTYNFLWNNRDIRLIDTPGLGDTGGIERDKENMKKILDHISNLDELHGICILLKANEKRCDAIFRFCLMELLVHLHKSAARNVLFCFTNSRSSFYKPGDTLSILQSLVAELNLNNMITLCNKTMFCLDNEAFRFLCTLKYQNIPHSDQDRQLYGESWVRSVNTTKQLFEQIMQLPPHTIKETTTLCSARSRILNLTKSIADISQNIHTDLSSIAQKEKLLNDSRIKLSQIDMRIPHIVLVRKDIDYPRTVCTNDRCVKGYSSKHGTVTNIEYVTICHNHCYINDIVPDTYPQPALRNCAAMGGKENCQGCGCLWDVHMHIRYLQEREETFVPNINAENAFRTEEEKVKTFKQEMEIRKRKLESEQEAIIQTSLKFGMFLKKNAIAPYNDGFRDYIKFLIRQEESKVNRTSIDDNVLRKMHDMMRHYEEEVKILEKTMQNAKQEINLSPRDIIDLEQQLYSLEIMGPEIKQLVEDDTAHTSKARRYMESWLPVKRKANRNETSQAKSNERFLNRQGKNAVNQRKVFTFTQKFTRGFKSLLGVRDPNSNNDY